MRVHLVFVPPGGGEKDYGMDFELPSAPQAGDYISIVRDDGTGDRTFIVRRTYWQLAFPSKEAAESVSDPHGTETTIMVECEFARGYFNSESHKRACDSYEAKGYAVPKLEATAY